MGVGESGILVVDKPQGVTSHDVVAAVRHALHMKRVGHAGTLDPMATGVLVIGFGHATRLLNYIVGADKTYLATIRLGQDTTTDDAEGEPITPENARTVGEQVAQLTRDDIEQTINEHLIGNIEQVPSTFSAIKINGKRAYDLARDGEAVTLKARKVTISEFSVLDVRETTAHVAQPASETSSEQGVVRSALPVVDVDVRVTCSSGTYIRALARDLGCLLGVGGHLTMLRRTRVGRFDVDGVNVMTAHAESRTFTNRDGEQITRNRAVLDGDDDAAVTQALSMVDGTRLTMASTIISDEDAANLRFGRMIAWPAGVNRSTETLAVCTANELVAIVQPARAAQAKPVVVFPAETAAQPKATVRRTTPAQQRNSMTTTAE